MTASQEEDIHARWAAFLVFAKIELGEPGQAFLRFWDLLSAGHQVLYPRVEPGEAEGDVLARWRTATHTVEVEFSLRGTFELFVCDRTVTDYTGSALYESMEKAAEAVRPLLLRKAGP